MNPLIELKTTPLLLIAFLLACLAFSPRAQALLPPPAPDGGYPGGNTAEGVNALHDVNTAVGINNTAVGLNALTHDTTGQYNVAVGSGALQSNTTGDFNMAIGAEALRDNNASFNLAIGFRVGFMNTTGRHLTGIGAAALRNNTTASFNTAIGADAMRENTTGEDNTAIGADALAQNTNANQNTAVGAFALSSNDTGPLNTAIGYQALFANVSGLENTAIGDQALLDNTGNFNVAVGGAALLNNTTGNENTAVGSGALNDTTGNDNTALGFQAGILATTGNGNVYIGAGMSGVAGEANHTYVRNINTTSVNGMGADTVTVNLTTGLLGHLSSSRRYKEDIKSMDKTSEALYELKPVTYRFKKEIDPSQSLEYGLVAEEVAQVNPNLAIRDGKGQIESVRYTAINAMLLNEFLKEHKKTEKLEATVASLITTVKEQAAQIQKVSAQLEASKSVPQVVNNP